MTIWYTARNIYNDSDSGWEKYIKWSGLTQVQEIVSLDSMLNELTFKWDHNIAENWEFQITTPNSYTTDCFSNLSFLLSKLDLKTSFNLLAVQFQPESPCEQISLDGFSFVGYDLLDQYHCNSVLTNCGGFPETFSNGELNKFGLIDNFERAIEVQKNILINNPDENHADTNIWAIWRHNQIGRP
jgi:hypothetical protein